MKIGYNNARTQETWEILENKEQEYWENWKLGSLIKLENWTLENM